MRLELSKPRIGLYEACMRAALCFTLASALVGCTSELAPFGEAIVIVDTDAQVPKLADTLRVDFFRDDGTWFESLDVRGLGRDAWPLSFSVFNEDETVARTVVLRLRAYPEGKVRDYRGERFGARPIGAPADPVIDPEPPLNAEPRLVRDGLDITPTTEPLPSFAMDRLVRIELSPGSVGRAAVVLRAACAATMANLATRESCIDAEGMREPLATVPLQESLEVASIAGSAFVEDACSVERRGSNDAPLYDEAVCIPGGILFVGDLGLSVMDATYQPSPERIAVVPTLFVDTYEVTVARWRAALARGFAPVMGGPDANDVDAPLVSSSTVPVLGSCTWSSAPLVAHPRESYPLDCVHYADARAFCQYLGGDLLTEAQWEYVAAASGRSAESAFAWGNQAPSCDTVVYARYDNPNVGGVACKAYGYGPAPVTEGTGDVTPGYGIRGLGGSLSEWVVDDFRGYRTVCWGAQPLFDPRCVDASAPNAAARGGSWLLTAGQAHGRGSAPKTVRSTDLGFRCAWLVAP